MSNSLKRRSRTSQNSRVLHQVFTEGMKNAYGRIIGAVSAAIIFQLISRFSDFSEPALSRAVFSGSFCETEDLGTSIASKKTYSDARKTVGEYGKLYYFSVSIAMSHTSLFACGSIHQDHERFSDVSREKQCGYRHC